VALKPGTDAYNCVVCGKTPFEKPVYRNVKFREWYCLEHTFDNMGAYEGPLYLPRQKQTYDGPVAPQATIPLSIDGVECPATMCPLIAKDGSPNANVYAGKCPEHDDLDHGGCPWWKIGCSTGLQQRMVDDAIRETIDDGGYDKPRRKSRAYDCPKASVCSWQKQAEAHGLVLCPPREALFVGLDPRVVNWS
jgi:hypothetical protein